MAVYKSLFGGEDVVTFGGGLKDKFGLPPFSVFDARSGDWQDRKAAWLSLGIKSELGRGENLLKMSDTMLEPDAKKRAAKKGLTYNCGGPGTLLREFGQVNTGGVIRSKATGADEGFQGTPNMKGKPDNPEMRIPGWYSKLKKGMTKEEIIAEWQAQQTTHVQTASLKGGSTYRLTIGAYDRAGTETSAAQTGTSIFDPVLCEMFYRWFVPPRGVIVDPFAGGSVRGIVASRLNYQYTGFDLRQEQVDANRAQALELCKPSRTAWICDDSRNVLKHLKPNTADALFSCPPYADLERYSDDPRDLSTLKYDEFLPAYEQIILDCSRVLKPNRFAAFVVGEVRDKDGNCYGFVPDTTLAFEKAGLKLYNDAVLLTAVGSLALRAEKQFNTSRKLGRCHQYVMIYIKGEPRKAVAAIRGKDAE